MHLVGSEPGSIEDTLMRDDEGDHVSEEVAALNQQCDELDDPRECYRLVQDHIRQHKNDGTTVPKDLTILERQLARECMAESQGR